MHSSKQSSQHPLEINYYYHSYFTEKNTEEREIILLETGEGSEPGAGEDSVVTEMPLI